MLCCKMRERRETTENLKFEEVSEEDEKIYKRSGIGPLDVKEWKIILRENIIVMDEYNMRMKKLKMKDLEEREARKIQARLEALQQREYELQRQRLTIEEQRKETSAGHNKITEKESEIQEKKQRLKAMEFEISEKDRLIEICFALQVKRDIDLESEQAGTDLREQEIRERERSIAERQDNLDKKEILLDIAISANDFR